jgi:hypothetical protein
MNQDFLGWTPGVYERFPGLVDTQDCSYGSANRKNVNKQLLGRAISERAYLYILIIETLIATKRRSLLTFPIIDHDQCTVKNSSKKIKF